MATTIDRFPPAPKRRYPGSHFVDLRRNPLAFFTRVAKECGDIGHFKIGPVHLYLLNNPEYIKDVLVTHPQDFFKGHGLQRAKRLLGEGLLTSEGEFHKRQRRLSQPAFHPQRVLNYAPAMTETTQNVIRAWKDGETRDIGKEMNHLALIIAGRTLFGADVEAEAHEISDALTTSMELFTVVMLPFAKYLENLPLPGVRRFKKSKARLDATIYRIIEQRRKSGKDTGDLLSMLLLAQDTEGDGGSMTDLQLRDECMTIFLAGHETTANMMTWTWYLLSQNPAAEARLHEELSAVLQGGPPTAADLAKLEYTESILLESMRLYPPAWIIGRRALREFELGGYTIASDSVLLMSQHIMHHNEQFFPEPCKFDPERWTESARAARPRYCYFPFGAGPRVCIGEAFAMMESKLLLATIAQKWRMRLASKQRVEPQALVTLRPKYGMKMTLEARQ